MFNLKSNFYEFFNENYELNSCNINRITNFGTNFYILYCIFQNFSIIGKGSTIFLNQFSTNFLIEYSSFYFCSSSDIGGAIFFETTLNGGFILNKICSYYCFTGISKYGQFFYSSLNNLNLNQINYLSISFCSPNHDIDRRDPFRQSGGNQKQFGINSSFNKAFYNNAFVVIYSTKFESKFNTFSNNIGKNNHASLLFQSSNGFLNNSNIINSTSPTYGIITVWTDGNYQLFNCIFYFNQNILFATANNGILLIKNSYIYHDPNNYGSLLIHNNFNNNYIYFSSYKLLHYNTFYCLALNPINNYQKSNLKNKKINLIFNLLINKILNIN